MTRLNITYKEMLSLSLQQPYYANGQNRKGAIDPLPDVALLPDSDTKALLQRMDLVVRSIPGGLIVLARVLGENEGGEPLLRFPAKASDKLSFLMQVQNPDVLSVHDLPTASDTSRLFYVSNTVLDGAASRQELHLSQLAGGLSGSDTMPYARNHFRYEHPAVLDPADVSITHLLSGARVPCRSCINDGGTANLLFDLSALPSGLCELWINGALEQEFYHLVDNTNNPVFGVVELQLQPGIAANYRIIEPDRSLSAERPRFVVGLQARKTRWRYTVQLQAGSPLAAELAAMGDAERAVFLSKLNILSNDPAVHFNAVSSTDPGILIYESASPLQLREAYFNGSGATLSLSLIKNIGDETTESIVKRNLPYPSSRLINTSTPPELYSDIFLTV